MNYEPPKPKSHFTSTAEHEVAVRRISDAAQQVQLADTPVSREQLRAAVDEARDAGVGWKMIGDTLGIGRGNAYKRYRTRPVPSKQRCDMFER